MRYIFFTTVVALCCFQSAATLAGPTLTVTEARRGSWSFTGLNDPMVIVTDPTSCEAVPWEFEWDAVAEPGRTIDAYRYGFDITDLNDDEAWDTDWCSCTDAPPHTFFFGTHTFHVEVRDNTGAVTRGSIRIDCVPSEAPGLTLTETEVPRGIWQFVGPQGLPVSLVEPVTDPPTPWSFVWEAVFCAQGGTSFLYRYGWDITDPDDDAQWTPWGTDTFAPSRALLAGTHSFMVEVKDANDLVTRGTVVIEITSGPVPVEKTTWGGVKFKYVR